MILAHACDDALFTFTLFDLVSLVRIVMMVVGRFFLCSLTLLYQICDFIQGSLIEMQTLLGAMRILFLKGKHMALVNQSLNDSSFVINHMSEMPSNHGI